MNLYYALQSIWNLLRFHRVGVHARWLRSTSIWQCGGGIVEWKHKEQVIDAERWSFMREPGWAEAECRIVDVASAGYFALVVSSDWTSAYCINGFSLGGVRCAIIVN